MTIHPRTPVVAAAKYEIAMAVFEAEEKHDLTIAEVVKILLEVALDQNKYAIRQDRHPNDPYKKGDEA